MIEIAELIRIGHSPDPGLPAKLYAVERAALHFLDLAMRIRHNCEHLRGREAETLLELLGERLDAVAVAVAGLRDA